MLHADWNFTQNELIAARKSAVPAELATLAKHTSRFVRAQVAGNNYISFELRHELANDSSRGVRMWLLGNLVLTKPEFDSIFNTSRDNGYCDVVTPALARSHLADIEQLTQLAHEHTWNIQIAILNNHKGRGEPYRKLIGKFLAKPDTDFKKWSEIEKLAYYRLNNTRLPPEVSGE